MNMTTAKKSSKTTSPDNSNNSSSQNLESTEEIENIAKQISDHAEAIYQEWKKRGLGPSEILKCHPESDCSFSQSFNSKIIYAGTNSVASAALLGKAPELSNNNLNQLVNSFVVEDKARIASQFAEHQNKRESCSSIKYAIKNLELQNLPVNVNQGSLLTSESPTNVSSSSSFVNLNNTNRTNNFQVPDVLKDTIEKCAKLQKPEAPVKPEYLLNHIPQWPFKKPCQLHAYSNRSVVEASNQDQVQELNYNQILPIKDVMSEVSCEEEKLIKSLITSNDSLPEVITSSMSDNQINIEQSFNNTNSVTQLSIISDLSQNQPQLPQKPNHTPIYVFSKDDPSKALSSFYPKEFRLSTTRFSNRHEVSKLDEKRFELKSIPSPIRPFLSRGSVAERVLIFEKCPEKPTTRLLTNQDKPKIQTKPVNKFFPPLHSTLQRHLRKSTSFTIPQFYYPYGKPPPSITVETTIQRLEIAFNQFQNYEIPREKFHIIVTICQVPLYWRVPLFMSTQLTRTGCVNGNRFIDFWRQMTSFCHDAFSRFVYIVSKGNKSRPWILPEDLAPLIQDVVDSHPGLSFLKEAAEFHSRYVHTVIARIFYSVNRSWSGKINLSELKRSNMLDVLQLLEEEEDINQIMAYFSYEHFYVIYCKFWELDRDHDLFIDQQDLARHNDHALSSRIIERIFSGCVTRGKNRNTQDAHGPKMSYTDFVYFLLSEEDKNHATSIEYWFRCMDIDGDGVLSMYELEYFYEEQQHRMEQLGIETLPFEDCLCQMLDMIKPIKRDSITLSDLKRCKMTPIFFDTFFNLEKYMEHEQRDPFAQKENDELSDWDRYAAEEYELLVAEESVDGNRFAITDEFDQHEKNIESLLESQIDSNEW